MVESGSGTAPSFRAGHGLALVENDDRKDRFRWDHQQEMVLERNDSQLTQPMATLLHCQRTEDV
jgi:hypothetical protein